MTCVCVCSESSWDLVKSPFWRKEGWMSTDIQDGRGRRHTSINSNMTFDVALVTLIQNTSLWRQCFAQWKSYKGSSAPLKSETAMSYGAEAPSLQRKSSYKWNGLSPQSQHVETDHEHQASRAAPGQPIISNDSSLTYQSWPLAVLEYIIHRYRCLQ